MSVATHGDCCQNNRRMVDESHDVIGQITSRDIVHTVSVSHVAEEAEDNVTERDDVTLNTWVSDVTNDK